MESLGDILRRIAAREYPGAGGGVRGGLPYILPEEPAADPCPVCQGAGWVSKQAPVGHPDFGEAFPCRRCQRQEPADRVEVLHRYSNLGALRRITLENTRREGPLTDAAGQKMFREALTAATAFTEKPAGWLVFTGPSGSGKTHLAVAAANRCIAAGITTYFIVAADLLDHLRAAYAPDNPVSYDELFEQVRNVPVLVLDDLTAQATTPWAREKLFQIISHRFNAELPTIITVRGPLERLEEGLRTRMETGNGFSRVFRLGEHNTRLARRVGDIPAGMLQRMTLENFDVRGGANASRAGKESLVLAWQAAKNYAADLAAGTWLLLTGPRGCGKTHLSIAIAGESLRQGRSVFRAFVPDLLDHLRATFNPDSPITYDELFEQVKTASLLILDDLGAESSTPWAEEKLYQIVVYRYDNRLPTVITSVDSVEQLAEDLPDIGSRLLDGTMVNWHSITAPNYRNQRRG